jgi:hypothetical protein
MPKKGCGPCKGGKKSAIRKVMSPGKTATGFPTLQDLQKTIPPGGLLNPGLRKGAGLGIPKGKKI